jgi:hypothetical protein
MGDVNGDWDPAGARPAPVLTDPERIKNAVKASVPRISSQQGEVVTVPFRIDNLKKEEVSSYQFDIAYDPAVITPADIAADLAGTVSESLAVAFNTPEAGLLKVVVYGAMPVNGDGVYVNLRFNTTGAGGSSTPLTVQNFRFNDGTADVVTINGTIRVLSADMEDAISGRLVSAYGTPVADTRVILTSTTGATLSATTSRDGQFEFIGLARGETYSVSAVSRRYTFAQRTVSVTGGTADVNMIAEQ